MEKALVLWSNSTMGLLLFIAQREETCGAWTKFKKPVLGAMKVLNVAALPPRTLSRLADVYDAVARKPLEPFSFVAQDPVRIEIDSGIARALRLPDLSPVREMLSREPILSLSLDRLKQAAQCQT
jgi:hypothetical protein